MNREEAIEIVKKNWPEGRHQIKEALEFLVPELKESEDEKTRKAIISTIENTTQLDWNISKEKMLAWLEKQKEQKPAEWSEEDEKTFNSIFNDFKQDVIPDEEDQEWLKNRLKSLRPQPHWKPSEEQIKALEDAKMRMSLDGYGICPLLQSLLDDLKKL